MLDNNTTDELSTFEISNIFAGERENLLEIFLDEHTKIEVEITRITKFSDVAEEVRKMLGIVEAQFYWVYLQIRDKELKPAFSEE